MQSLKSMKDYPSPIMVSELGSFAYKTVSQRLPAIAKRVIEDNDFPPEIVEKLKILIEELPEGKIRALESPTEAHDLPDWNRYLESYLDQSWLDLPWFFAEVYFYRRILEAIDYFRLGIDPYAVSKQLALEKSLTSIHSFSLQRNKFVGKWHHNELSSLIYCSLWGNRADLSLWSVNEAGLNNRHDQNEQKNLLVDDTAKLANWLDAHSVHQIDFVIDNAGLELFCDLCLVDYLLTTQLSETVCLHLKAHPTFVSDAMNQDVHYLVERLLREQNPEVNSLALRLQKHLESDRLKLQENLFWNSPLVFWEMPEELNLQLARAGLIIFKGDANYRRLLGDRKWSFTTPFQEIVSYFPMPLVALRTLKSELVCGLQSSQVEALNAQDPNWLINGQRGLIQFTSL